MYLPRTINVIGVGLIVVVSGCGDGLELHQVTGKVMYADGEPVQAGGVTCISTDLEPRRSASGSIRDDGTFTLGTRTPDDGLVAGNYLVTVSPAALPEGARNPYPIDPRYIDPSKTPIKFMVKAGENQVVLRINRPGEPAPTGPLVEVVSSN